MDLRQTQGDYRFENKIAGSKNRLRDMVNRDVFQVLEKYEKAMVMDSLSDAAKAKNFDTILGLTRLLPQDKSWLELDKDSVEDIVVAVMNKYGENGKEVEIPLPPKVFKTGREGFYAQIAAFVYDDEVYGGQIQVWKKTPKSE